jgi:hypothetical protein
MLRLRSQAHFKFSSFADKILRNLDDDSCEAMIEAGLKIAKTKKEELAKIAIKHGLMALNDDYPKAADIIPRMLDIVSQYSEATAQDFKAYSKDTPLWYFVRWINQLASIMNSPQSGVIESKLI